MTCTLTLSMIVRDAAKLLPACLGSVRGIVDEIVIADTGSQDGTIPVAQSLGARVVSIPWDNDFAAARNAALREVHSLWVLSLDADEQLDESAREQIPRLLKIREREKSRCAGYQVTIRNYMRSIEDRIWDRRAQPNDSVLSASRNYPAYVEHQNVRLFLHDPQVFFVGRVHESVGPAIEQAGRRIGEADFLIHHFGLADDETARARKNHAYRELGREKIREMPDNAQAHFELGLLELDNFHNFAAARELFERARKLNPRFGVAWFFEGLTLSKLGQPSEALRCLGLAERSGHCTALVAETRGDLHYNLSQFSSACECYATARRRDPVNAGLQSKFGLATLRTGNRNRGMRELRHAIAASSQSPDVHDRFVLALVWIGDLGAAALAADAKLLAITAPLPSDFLRAASLWSKAGDRHRATQVTHQGLEAHPDDRSLRQAAQELNTSPQIPTLVSAAK
jgi:glycosyltransferase involved in cell wall biosynthesis